MCVKGEWLQHALVCLCIQTKAGTEAGVREVWRGFSRQYGTTGTDRGRHSLPSQCKPSKLFIFHKRARHSCSLMITKLQLWELIGHKLLVLIIIILKCWDVSEPGPKARQLAM